MGNDGSGAIALIGFLLLLVLSAALYLIPTLVAVLRKHHQVGAIVAINILLGWTFLGWVVALALSLSAKRAPASQVNVYNGYGPPGRYGPPGPPLPYRTGAWAMPPADTDPSRSGTPFEQQGRNPYEQPRRDPS